MNPIQEKWFIDKVWVPGWSLLAVWIGLYVAEPTTVVALLLWWGLFVREKQI